MTKECTFEQFCDATPGMRETIAAANAAARQERIISCLRWYATIQGFTGEPARALLAELDAQ
jgi:hypothetical protein